MLHEGCRRLLAALLAALLAGAQPANRGHLYRLNRDHVLAVAVSSACRARVTLLARLAEAVPGLHPQPVHASVFGSFAHREGGPSSDIDLLLVLKEEPEAGDGWYEQQRALGDRVLAWTGNRLECLAFGDDDLRGVVARGEAIVGSWLNDSLTVHGESIDVVVRRLAPDARRGRQ